jgi:hypothetical protein
MSSAHYAYRVNEGRSEPISRYADEVASLYLQCHDDVGDCFSYCTSSQGRKILFPRPEQVLSWRLQDLQVKQR